MREFKVGDKVTVTETGTCGSQTIKGQVYYVHSIDDGTCNLTTVAGVYQGVMCVTEEDLKFISNIASPSGLPDDAKERKGLPLYSGLLKYFPLALVEVARLSKVGNDQHNPNQPLHWDRSKSGDELDALTRHLLEAGTVDTDGVRHSVKVAWRALANLQKELEAQNEEKKLEKKTNKGNPMREVMKASRDIYLSKLKAVQEKEYKKWKEADEMS